MAESFTVLWPLNRQWTNSKAWKWNSDIAGPHNDVQAGNSKLLATDVSVYNYTITTCQESLGSNPQYLDYISMWHYTFDIVRKMSSIK